MFQKDFTNAKKNHDYLKLFSDDENINSLNEENLKDENKRVLKVTRKTKL